jgi:hypothetical protein
MVLFLAFGHLIFEFYSATCVTNAYGHKSGSGDLAGIFIQLKEVGGWRKSF